MTAQNRTTLKTYFNTGDVPSESQFANLIDGAGNTVEANTWTASQTFQAQLTYEPQSGTTHTLRTIDYDAIDANCRTWRENMGTFSNTGGPNNNNTWQWGYNNAPGGGPFDASEPTLYLQLESNYNPSGAAYGPIFEYHLNFYSASSASFFRPFTWIVERDGTLATAAYVADKYDWFSRTGYQLFTIVGGSDAADSRFDLNAHMRVLDTLEITSGNYLYLYSPSATAYGSLYNDSNMHIDAGGISQTLYMSNWNSVGIIGSMTIWTSQIDVNKDFIFSASTIGPVLKDTTDGHTYRLTSTSGSLVMTLTS